MTIVAGLPCALGVAVSYVTGQLIAVNIQYWYVGRHGPVRTMDFYRTIIPSLLHPLRVNRESCISILATSRECSGRINSLCGNHISDDHFCTRYDSSR